MSSCVKRTWICMYINVISVYLNESTDPSKRDLEVFGTWMNFKSSTFRRSVGKLSTSTLSPLRHCRLVQREDPKPPRLMDSPDPCTWCDRSKTSGVFPRQKGRLDPGLSGLRTGMNGKISVPYKTPEFMRCVWPRNPYSAPRSTS